MVNMMGMEQKPDGQDMLVKEKEQDIKDRLRRQDTQDRKLIYSGLTDVILKSCFEVLNELGAGFLESVYKNSLFLSLREKGMQVSPEKSFEVFFHGTKVGHYIADLTVNDTVIIELKCCDSLLSEHQAQTINYLKASNIPIGILVNFSKPKLEYKRLHNPSIFLPHPVYPAGAADPFYPVPSFASKEPVGSR